MNQKLKADLEVCEGTKRKNAQFVRCENKTSIIAENVKKFDSMGLCGECCDAFQEINKGEDFFYWSVSVQGEKS